MIKKRFEQMAEYILPLLEASGQKFELKVNKVSNVGILPVLKEDNKRILLIDRTYTEEEYQTIINIANKHELDFMSIFYKDGKHYFRSAAFGEKSNIKGIKYKQLKELSLKDYTNNEVARMILLTQPELIHLKKDNNILYYQPKLEYELKIIDSAKSNPQTRLDFQIEPITKPKQLRLEEALVRYRYTPVRFSYNHIVQEINEEGKKTYMPENANSKRIYISKLTETLQNNLIFENHTLRQCPF